eukprot:6418270-Prymnesium_polylepis.1
MALNGLTADGIVAVPIKGLGVSSDIHTFVHSTGTHVILVIQALHHGGGVLFTRFMRVQARDTVVGTEPSQIRHFAIGCNLAGDAALLERF